MQALRTGEAHFTGLTDCISVAPGNDEGRGNDGSARDDRHFEQEGLRALFRSRRAGSWHHVHLTFNPRDFRRHAGIQIFDQGTIVSSAVARCPIRVLIRE
jgi:hypothetical protein